MKKTFVITTLILAMILLGVFGGLAAAERGDQGKTDRSANIFTARMAEILGIEQARVEQAFKQAILETRDERANRHLERLVETGKLTQEQADSKLEWIKDNPGFLKKKHHSRFRDPNGKAGHFMDRGRLYK